MIGPPLRSGRTTREPRYPLTAAIPLYPKKTVSPGGGRKGRNKVAAGRSNVALAGGSSAALHNVLIGHGPSRVRSESIRSCYVKAGQGRQKRQRSSLFAPKTFECAALKRKICFDLNMHLRLEAAPGHNGRSIIKAPTMPGKNYFRYKKGRTEIESGDGNKAAITLAYLHTVLFFILQILAIIVLHKILSG